MPTAFSNPLPPNPSLVAVLLVVASRAGPRLVFHYPPTPHPAPSSSFYSAHPNWYNSSHAEDSNSDSSSRSGSSSGVADSNSSDDDDHELGSDYGAASSSRGSTGRTTGGSRSGSRHDAPGSGSMRSSSRSMWSNMARESLDDPLESLRGSDLPGGPGEKGKGAGSDAVGHKKEKTKIGPRREWEVLLDYSAESLAKLLNPSTDFRKRRFELGIDGLCFLGAPMFERGEGRWMKKKRFRRRSRASPMKEDTQDFDKDAAGQSTMIAGADQNEDDLDVPTSGIATPASQVPGFESGYGHGQMSIAVSEAGSDAKSTSTNDDHDMSMFNVVFVIDPPALEYQQRVEEMYDNVVKKFSKALKWEQARTNFVWSESKKILEAKAKARENNAPIFTLWPTLIGTSALAKSMAILYDCISQSKIAHIYFSDQFDASFQVPQAISTPYVPTTTEPQMPGLWLTTTFSYIDDDDGIDNDVSRHSALLLLEDVEPMLKAIEAEAHKELSSHLAHFIRIVNPAMSLHQLAQVHSVSIRDVTILARHLIYWRKARAIPPLHHRDTYIVSPNADMSSLASASEAYAKHFPTLPGLTKMLSLLGEAPRQYRHCMPSKDHRGPYMKVLAWLMSGGWVTQLRTFGWVRISAEVKAAVATKIEAERKAAAAIDVEKEKADATQEVKVSEREDLDPSEDKVAPLFSHSRSQSQSSDTTVAPTPPSATSAVLSPHTVAYRSPSRAGSDTGSTSSSRTAVLTLHGTSPPATQPHRPSPLHVAQSATSIDVGSRLPISPSLFAASIIRSPQKATALESQWIEHIGATFTEKIAKENEKIFKEREELAEAWPVILKYLDGRHALDEVAGREAWKRSKVLGVVSRLAEAGVLVTVRHW